MLDAESSAVSVAGIYLSGNLRLIVTEKRIVEMWYV